MRFWDASAIVSLIVPERSSEAVRAELEKDRAVAVWWGTPVEAESALRRRERAGIEIGNSLRLLEQLAHEWAEVGPTEPLRALARRLVAVHPLRAADALQLAAAIAWRHDLTREAEIVCLDERLRDAAAREGFGLVPAEV